ncbi:YheT family hydrolase [Marinimicrobium locisalis]|uniref:YheT family hydrolase n=1 Tax=Marinimicrobium locisalis TaxID=546022 RepID=UPI00322151A6
MPLIQSEYQCPWWFKNGHVQTLHPRLRPERPAVRPREVTLNTPDEDFLELFVYEAEKKALVIITHGLESHGKEAALLRFANKVSKAGYDAMTWSMRSCGKQINRTKWFYNGCDYRDLKHLIDTYAPDYDAIYLVGFSLGGSITANYLGREGAACHPVVKGAFLVSPPLELDSFHASMRATFHHALYQRQFVKSLLGKFEKKRAFIDFGPEVDSEKVLRARTVDEIEHHLFAPLHGYKSSVDYRRHAAALPHLENTPVPTYILCALDDPFIEARHLPYQLAETSSRIHLEVARHGGHTGFIRPKGEEGHWYERRFFEFIESLNEPSRRKRQVESETR